MQSTKKEVELKHGLRSQIKVERDRPNGLIKATLCVGMNILHVVLVFQPLTAFQFDSVAPLSSTSFPATAVFLAKKL